MEDKMIGLELSVFTKELHHLESDLSDPLENINWEERLKPCREYIEARFNLPFDFKQKYHNLPLGCLKHFSFDELCRLKHASVITMDGSIDKLFEENPQYEIIRKIESSLWRW